MGLTYEEFEGKFNLKKRKLKPGQLENLLSGLWTPSYDNSFVLCCSVRDVSVTLGMACITGFPQVDLGGRNIEDLSEEEITSLYPYFGYSWPAVVEHKPPRSWGNLFGIIPRPVIREERLVRKLLSFDGEGSAAYGSDLLYIVMESEKLNTKVRVRADSGEDAEYFTGIIRGFIGAVNHLNEYPSTWRDRLHNPEKFKTE